MKKRTGASVLVGFLAIGASVLVLTESKESDIAHEPEAETDEGWWTLPGASWAARGQLSSLSMTNMSDPQMAVHAEIAEQFQDLVGIQGIEAWNKSVDPAPSGASSTSWRYHFYNSTKESIRSYWVSGAGQEAYGPELDGIEDGLEDHWSSARIETFQVDSDQAVAIAHASGGASASVGMPEVKIRYWLQEVDGVPRWDIAYYGPEGSTAFYAASVDATNGSMEPALSHQEIDGSRAAALANPVEWAADAVLVAQTAFEGHAWIMYGLPTAMETTMGDGRSTTWELRFYSPSLATVRTYRTLGDELHSHHDALLDAFWIEQYEYERRAIENATGTPKPLQEIITPYWGRNLTTSDGIIATLKPGYRDDAEGWTWEVRLLLPLHDLVLIWGFTGINGTFAYHNEMHYSSHQY